MITNQFLSIKYIKLKDFDEYELSSVEYEYDLLLIFLINDLFYFITFIF